MDRARVALAVETSNAAGRDMLRGVARYARERAGWSMYHQPGSMPESLSWLLRNASRLRFDGILARIDDPGSARRIAGLKAPVVDLYGNVPGYGLPLVHVDNAAIGKIAAEHLLERGYQSLATVGTDFRRLNWAVARGQGFEARLRKGGASLALFQSRERKTRIGVEKRMEQLVRWLLSLPKPVGVFCVTDLVGRRVLEACRRAELDVPDEVAVLGVDNDEILCDLSAPPLSSVDPNHIGVGYEGAALLDRIMTTGRRPSGPHLLEPTGIVVRASTDKWAVPEPDVAKALAFIHEQSAADIAVGDVVERVALARRSLERRFRKVVGRSIYDEILRERTRRVQELLANTTLPIKMIAAQTGFSHPEHMSKLFRARFGRSPHEYRSAIRRGGRVVTEG